MDPDLKFRNQQHDGRNAIIGGVASLAVIPAIALLGDYAPAALVVCIAVGLYFVLRKHK